MKKLIIPSLILVAFSTSGFAQTTPTNYKFKRSVPTLAVQGAPSSPSNGASSPATDPSTPKAPKLIASSTDNLLFSDTNVGDTSSAKSVLVLNEGNDKYVFPSDLLVSGLNPGDYYVTSNCVGATLMPLDSCAINVAFSPLSMGTKTASLSLPFLNTPATVGLSGLGLGYIFTFSPSSVSSFSAVVGETSANSSAISLIVTGNKNVLLNSYSITGPFSLASSTSGCSAVDLTTSPVNLNNETCSYSFKFSPVVEGANQSGVVTFNTSEGSKILNLSGSTLSRLVGVDTTTLNYIGTTVGSSYNRSVTVTNQGQSNLTLNPNISVGGSDFSIVSPSGATDVCSTSLNAGQTCKIYIAFTPTVAGTRTGTLNVGSNATNAPTTVSLSGPGLVYLSEFTADTSTDFGSLFVGQSASRTFTFKNTGNTILSGIYPTLAGTDLSLESNTCGTVGTPINLGPGNTCTVQIKYAPSTVSSLSAASIKVNSNSTSSPNSLTLTGQAIAGDPDYANVALFMNMNGVSGNSISSSADATGKSLTTIGTAPTYTNTAVFGQAINFASQATGGGGACTPAPVLAVEVARNGAFEMDTTNYTLEMRVRPTIMSGYQGLLSYYESCSGVRGWGLYFQGNKMVFNYGNGADRPTTFTSTFVANTWYHIALVKSGTTVSLYVNGVKDATVGSMSGYIVTSNNGGTATKLRIGSLQTVNNSGLVGQLDEVRMTRNVARYSANFTPNSTALTYP